jgi:fucose 4-O-acetylase-like acetyltransferase
MWTRSMQMAEATPPSRDRFIDAARGFAILVVVLGHWLIAVVSWQGGEVEGTNALAVIPGLWIVTWVLQVMPLFFFVGGAANAWTWSGVVDRAGSAGPGAYAGFVAGRVTRLLRPTAVFLGIGLAVATVLDATNVADSVLRPATRLITQPLWFIGIYLIVVALAPPMLALHRRFGAGVPAALAAGAVAVDLLRFGADLGGVGYVNFALVWLFVHQLGFFYADGRLPGRPWRYALAGLAAMVLLVVAGPYPGSMVGLPGDEISNMDPPTVVILALTLWQAGLALTVRPAVDRLLRRARAWAAVIAVNAVIMTVFLWHLTALLLAIGILYPLGFPQPAAGTTQWWVLRPVWVAVLLALLGVLVALFGRFEMGGRRDRAAPPDAAAAGWIALSSALGSVYVVVGVLGFALGGLDQVFSTTGSELVIFRVNPLVNVIHLALGAGLVRAAARSVDGARRAALAAAVVLAAMTALGWLWAGGSGTNYLAANAAVNVLHAVTAAMAAAAAWGSGRPSVTPAAAARA